MSTLLNKPPTIEDLYNVPEQGKAEIVNGELVSMPPTGDNPIYAGREIVFALRDYEKQNHTGLAVPDNAAFLVDLPHRKSLSPDAAFYTGPRSGMKFFPQVPVFAVEIRSEHDYGSLAEEKMAQKRVDYFTAGTLVVWDVDLLSEDVVKVYRATDPNHPTIYRRGGLAEAEPAVPGWTMPVDNLFS